MRKYLALSATLLLASLPSFASHVQPSPSSQIRLKHSHAKAKASSRPLSGETDSHRQSGPVRPDHVRPEPAQKITYGNARVHPHSLKARRNGITASSVALVSAIQAPLGGFDDDNTGPLLGDFNGDGKQDIAKLVYNVVSNVTEYEISVVLGNSNGVVHLTPAPNNVDDPIIVGDVNGDGKDDIIMVHPAGGGCRAAERKIAPSVFGCGATFDVLISNGDGTFTLGNNYFISNFSLNGGLLTDINGDGKLDILAVDSETPGLVMSVLGNGDGTFQNVATTFATLSGVAPQNLFFADFNGDGTLDFAGADNTTNQINVYLASGSGSFAAPVALITPNATYDSCFNTAGDLSGDSKPEIVSTNCRDNTITVYLNNGDGSFQNGVYYDNAGDLATSPEAATIADMNGDGNNDIVVANPGSGMITVFLGNGDGTVAIPTIGYTTGGFPFTAPLLADFTGDGLPDVVVADDYNSFVLLAGYGDGTLAAAPAYSIPGSFSTSTFSYSVAAGDFHGDGFPDVVVGADGKSAAGITVYLANSDGSLKPGVSYGTNTLAYVTVADFNGDGKLDIAATDFNNGVVQIFLGVGDGTFTVGSAYATDTNSGPEPWDVISGDFNKDGKLDLAIANNGSGTVGVLFGNGDGTFGAATSYSLSVSPISVVAADVNGDGHLDLVLPLGTGSANNVAVLLSNNDNTGTFQAETDVAMGGGQPEYVAVGDLNGDGKPDLVLSMNSGASFPSALVVALGNGDGTFQAPTAYASSAQEGGLGRAFVANVQMFDLNGDGKLDLIYINNEFGTVGVMTGNGDGTFAAPVEFPTTEFGWGLALADVNNDGAMDVVMGNDNSGGVTVLLNANGTGTAPNYTLGTQTPSATVTAGSPATYDLTAAGRFGYTGTITFSCSGLPTGASCSFSPASVIANGDVPLPTTLTVSTTASKAASARALPPTSNPGAPTLLAGIGGVGLFGLLLAGRGKKGTQRRMTILLGLTLMVAMFTLVGCDNNTASTSTGTPAGTYTFMVTSAGTGANAPTHTVSETLVVQ